VLRGNLAPGGALIKPSAATPSLLKHSGRAVVFKDIEDFKARIDDPTLEIDENSVMVLQGAGPKGYPGMPEVGNMPMPKKLLERGITDLVRVSDARMSGTAYGTVVLHVTPESTAGGTLALVQNGDEIELNVEARKLELCVPEEEISRRRKAWTPPQPVARGGYQQLYIEHVLQADKGADLDFLVGCRGAAIPRESH
jgi:L-arabonate dehydrase